MATPTPATTINITTEAPLESFGTRLRDTDYAVEMFKRWEVLIFLVWIPLVFFAARFIFWLSFRRKFADFSLRHQLTVEDNKACGVSFAGYLMATALVMYGAMSDQREGESAKNLGSSIAWSVVGQFLLIVGEFLNDLVLHTKIDYKDEIVKNKNLAVGVVNGGIHVASGIVVRFIVSGAESNWGEAFLSTLILWVVSQIAFVVFIHVYDLITRGVDIQEELLKDNVPVGTTVGVGVISAALYITAPVEKSESVVALALWFVCGLVVFVIIKFLTDLLWIKNVLVFDETHVPNWAASGVEGSALVFASLIARAFITFSRCGEDPRAWKERIVDWDFTKDQVFRGYNLVFIAFIFIMLFVAKAVFKIPDMIRAAQNKRSVLRVFRQFLKVRVADAPRALAQQLSWSASIRRQLEDSEGAKAGKKFVLIVFSTSRSIEFAGFLLGIGLVIQGALNATVDPTEKWTEVLAYFLMWTLLGFGCVGISYAITHAILWGDRKPKDVDGDTKQLDQPAEVKAEQPREAEPDAAMSREGTSLAAEMELPPAAKGAEAPVDLSKPVSERENIASSLVDAAGYIGSGLIVGACLGSMQGGDSSSNSNKEEYTWGEDIATVCIFFSIAQALLIIAGRLYQVVTKYNDVKEVRNGNVAAGLSAALNWVALAVCAAGPVRKNDSVLAVFVFFILAVIILHVMRLIVDKIILMGEDLDTEIVEDKNYAAALIEGSAAIGTALILTTFLPDQCQLDAVVS